MDQSRQAVASQLGKLLSTSYALYLKIHDYHLAEPDSGDVYGS